MQRFMNRRLESRAAGPSGEPESPGGGGLLQQANGYGNAARKAMENLPLGKVAEEELAQRRNNSAQ